MQYRVGDERQILSPDELETGMHIGVAVIGGIRAQERLRRSASEAAMILAGGAGLSNLWRITRPWESNSQENLVVIPEWHGVVDEVRDSGCHVELIGRRHDAYSRPAGTFDELPKVEGNMGSAYQAMGLAPYAGTPKTEWMAEDYGGHGRLAGRWEPVATLNLD
jgi:hypothetical protein